MPSPTPLPALPLLPPGLPLWALLAAEAVILFSAFVQGSIGLGFAIVSVPVMALCDPRLAPVPQLLLAAPLTFYMWWRERGATDWRGIGWVLLGRLPGAVIGVVALRMASPRLLDLLIAGCVLLGVAALASGKQLPRTPPIQALTGVFSAISAVVSSIGGPPLALLYGHAHAETLRASLATIFSIGLLITITARLVAGAITVVDLQLALWLLPALALGLAASKLMIRRLGPRASLRRPVLIVSALAAVGIVVRTLLR